jgi:hypothetical protein
MGGLFVLGMIGLWIAFSIWFSQVMVNVFIKDGTALKTVFRVLLALFLITLLTLNGSKCVPQREILNGGQGWMRRRRLGGRLL